MIKVYDVELSQHYEAGNMVTFRCPKCNEKIFVARDGWWENKCRCGFRWYSEVYAYTDDGDEDD